MRRHPAHRVYPYLLKGVAISMDGRGRCMDNIFLRVRHQSIIRRPPARVIWVASRSTGGINGLRRGPGT